MELNGARSNPFTSDKDLLSPLTDLHRRLLRKAAVSPRQPRPAPPKASPVLETVTLVLELAGEPMQALEIHAAAEQLLGNSLRWSSVSQVTMFVGDKRIDLAAGDYCFGPRGIPHAYLVRSERARMLVTISPSGSRTALRLARRPRHRRRAPDRHGHAAAARDGTPVRRLWRRDPRTTALPRRALLDRSWR